MLVKGKGKTYTLNLSVHLSFRKKLVHVNFYALPKISFNYSANFQSEAELIAFRFIILFVEEIVTCRIKKLQKHGPQHVFKNNSMR